MDREGIAPGSFPFLKPFKGIFHSYFNSHLQFPDSNLRVCQREPRNTVKGRLAWDQRFRPLPAYRTKL